ncbi:MAG: hypothetical protein EHM87_19890 [Burkholderiales bacterium]|nr:MAG: hypothetical protein EHM87_19890 [Burkholderiales bacterium]
MTPVRRRRGAPTVGEGVDTDEVGELPRPFTAALGLVVGAVLGTLVGLVLTAQGGAVSIGRAAAMGGGIGLLVGAVSRTLGLGLFEGLLHALVGFAVGARNDGSLPPHSSAGPVLRLMLWLGFFGAVALILWFWY